MTARDTTKRRAGHPEAPTPPLPDVVRPSPAPGEPIEEAGAARDRAWQSAENGVLSRAIDPENVEAGVGPTGFDRLTEATLAVQRVAIRQGARESAAAAAAAANEAERGRTVQLPAGYGPDVPLSEAGTRLETARRDEAAEHAEKRNKRAAEVLAGREEYSDGTRRPGDPIAEHTDERTLPRTLVLWTVWTYLPLAVALGVEGTVTAKILADYLSLDSRDWITPALMSVSAIFSLTLPPHIIGGFLGKVVHGYAPHAVQWIALAVGGAWWIGIGVTLGLVRVSVDRTAAIDAAYRQQLDDWTAGTPTPDRSAIDPKTAFPQATTMTWTWIAILLGIGVCLILLEVFWHNPARLSELRTRIGANRTRTRAIQAAEHEGSVAGAVTVQKESNRQTELAWTDQLDLASAEAELKRQIWREGLRISSGDPRMDLAIGIRDAATESLRAPESRGAGEGSVGARAASSSDGSHGPNLTPKDGDA